jgi:hypothetical protein
VESIGTEVFLNLHEDLTPFGLVALMEGPHQRRPRTLLLTADAEAFLTVDDQERFTRLFEEIVPWEGYLHAALAIGGEPTSCVWHILNGDVFPLSADHARAMLLYRLDLAGNDQNGRLRWPLSSAPQLI